MRRRQTKVKMNELGQLVPLVVPWSVAPSTPYLQLCADEECKAFVTFIGFFAFYEGDNQIDPKDIGPDGRLLPSAGTTNVDPHKTDGRYQQVRVDFTSVYCACLSAPMSSKKIFDTDLFELSPVLDQGQKQSGANPTLQRPLGWPTFSRVSAAELGLSSSRGSARNRADPQQLRCKVGFSPKTIFQGLS